MKKFNPILMLLALTFFLISCGSSWDKEELTKEVKKDIFKELDKKAKEQGISFELIDLVLVEKEKNKYEGILTTLEDGKKFSYEVDVTTDGESFIWKIPD